MKGPPASAGGLLTLPLLQHLHVFRDRAGLRHWQAVIYKAPDVHSYGFLHALPGLLGRPPRGHAAGHLT